MGLINQTTVKPSGSSGGFGGFAGNKSSFTGLGSRNKLSPDDLLQRALQEGGNLGQVAQELVHPETSILSTIGDGFKKSFKNFVEVISVPGQVVAGTISGDVTIKEAIQQNIDPSDVIWGDRNPDATLSQKVGGFLVRTATDILLDPLTYITFGGAKGILGLSSAPRVTLRGKAAKEIGLDDFAARELSGKGLDVFKYVKNLEHQADGTAKILDLTSKSLDTTLATKNLKQLKESAKAFNATKTSSHELIGAELKQLLDTTVDAKLGFDYSKRAMSNLLAKNPGLVEELIDKGGFKFMGKSLLSGQKMRSVMSVIPGMTHVDRLTQPVRGALGAMFDPAVVKVNKQFVRLPEEFVNIRQAGQDLATSLGDERLIKLADVVRANKLNVNESRFLTASIEAGKLPVDSRLANAYKQLLGFNEEEFDLMKSSGVMISRRDNHVPHMLVKNDIVKIPFATPPKAVAGASFQRKLEGEIFQISDEGLEALETTLTGGDKKLIEETFNDLKTKGYEIFDDNVVTALAKRSLDNTRVSVSRQFITSVAEAFGTSAGTASKGFVKINSKAFKEEGGKVARMLGTDGEDIVYHPAVAKAIEDFVGAVNSDDSTAVVLKAFDNIQNLWKASVTTIFPAFHGRNGVSNVFLNFNDIGLHSLDPRLHAQSGSLLLADRKANSLTRKSMKPGKAGEQAMEELQELMEKKVFTDNTGHSWSFGELRTVAKNNNVAFSRQLTGALDISQSPETFITTLFRSEEPILKKVVRKGVPVTQEFAPFAIGRGIGRAVEEQARLINFLANLNATGDVMHAAQRTKQFLFDYQNLTGFERNVMKRMIPFYTFTRKNLELQVKTLFKTPGRISAQFTALQNVGDAMAGGQLTEEQREALPDWIKDGIAILKSNKDGTVEILGSLGTPIEQPFQQFQPNIMLGSVSPLIRAPVEHMSGYSFFHGKAMSDITNASAFKNAPKVIKDFIGFTEVKFDKDGEEQTWNVALRPERMNLIQNFPFTSRVLSSLKQMQNENISGQSKILQQLVGVRPLPLILKQNRLRERKS